MEYFQRERVVLRAWEGKPNDSAARRSGNRMQDKSEIGLATAVDSGPRSTPNIPNDRAPSRAGSSINSALAIAAMLFSVPSWAQTDIVGTWAFVAGGCTDPAGTMSFSSDGRYTSDCDGGTWSLTGNQIEINVSGPANAACVGVSAPPGPYYGTVLDQSGDSLTVRWQTTGATTAMSRCR